MFKTKLLLTLAGSLGLATFLPAAPALLDLVEADSPVVLSISDVPAFRKNWETSPFAKTWNDPQIVKFLSPLRAKMEIDQWDEKLKKEINMSLDELLSLAQGDALIALTSLEFALGDSAPEADDVPLLIAAHLGKNSAEVEKLLATLIAKDKEKPGDSSVYETEEFSGVTIHLEKQKQSDGSLKSNAAWAIVDGCFLLSPSRQQVIKAIDAFKQGGLSQSLAKNERYIALAQKGGASDLALWLNVQAIYPIGQAAVAKATGNAQPNPFLPNPAGILPALGLDALKEIYISAKLGEETSTSFSAITWSEKRGLLKLIAPQPGLPELPNFITARSPLASAGNYDFNVFWPTLKEIVGEISPAALGYAQGQIMSLNQQLNVDLERGIFGSFAPGVYSAYILPAGSTPDNLPSFEKIDQLIAFNLSDSAAFTQATEALKTLAGENIEQFISKRDYLGQTLYTVNMPGGRENAKTFSYVVTPKTLLIGIGAPTVLEGCLQSLAGKAPTFFEQDWVKSRLASLPANSDTVQLADLAPIVTMVANLAVEYAKKADDSGKPNDVLDLSAAPNFALFAKYWGYSLSHSHEESGGYYTFSRVDHKR